MSSSDVTISLDVVFGASPPPTAPTPPGGAASQGTVSSVNSFLSRGVVIVESVDTGVR
jgi:hypothetical protein